MRSTPRYEFRLFGPDLGEQSRNIAAAMNESDSSSSGSLYVVWNSADNINVKLRDGSLDIKRLISIDRGFEQWYPDNERRFPLDPEPIERLPDLFHGGIANAGAFVERCRHAGYALIHVLKRRRHFEMGALIGESCRLLVNGSQVESIAIESTDLAMLGEFCSRLRFDAGQNTSYPAMLKQLTGMVALPADSPYRAYPYG